MDVSRNGHVLSLDEIMAVDDRPESAFYVDEWGGTVMLRKLSIDQALLIRKASLNAPEDDREVESMILLLAYGITQPALTPEQARALLDKSVEAFNRLAKELSRINGFAKEFPSLAEDAFRGGGDGSAVVLAGARTGDDGQAGAP